jgi:hypothetical protein
MFDTPCYRKTLQAFVTDPKNNAQELAARSQTVVSVRDILVNAGTRLRIEVSFDRSKGYENLNQATVTFMTPDSPEMYAEMVYPYLGFSYRDNRWFLSALFPAF